MAPGPLDCTIKMKRNGIHGLKNHHIHDRIAHAVGCAANAHEMENLTGFCQHGKLQA
jgi:hypothetical protein